MLAYWNSELRCRFANRAYERWFGVSPEALIGKHISELLRPLYPLNLPYIKGVLRGEPQEFEREIPDPAGGLSRHSLATRRAPGHRVMGGECRGLGRHFLDPPAELRGVWPRTPSVPSMFTADGSRLLVTASDPSMFEWWSWSFAPRPESIRVLPRDVTDTAGNQLLSGELRTALRHRRGGVRLATLDPTGKRPWKVSPPLRQVRQGMLTPLVLGDKYELDRDATREIAIPAVYRVLDISADGRLLLVLTHGGLMLYDVDAPALGDDDGRPLVIVHGMERALPGLRLVSLPL